MNGNPGFAFFKRLARRPYLDAAIPRVLAF
jgi:hypothetical protein